MPKNNLRQIITIALLSGAVSFSALPFVFAANNQPAPKQEQVKLEVFSRDVTGEVSGITKNSISVIYGQNEKESLEIALTIDKNTKGSYNKNLKEIKTGDIVAVTYQETVQTKPGEKPRVMKRLAKVVEFRRAASVAAPEGSILESK